MEHLRRDCRQALRALRRAPGFTLVSILTLGVAIGAVTALFSVIDGVVLKPLRYPHADRLVAVVDRYPDRTVAALSGGDFVDLAAERAAFAAVAYYFGGEMGVQVGEHAEFVGARIVHPDFFRVFTVAPVAGRVLNPDDAQRSAIVSAGFARRNFGDAAGALGRTVFLEDRSYEIVGVVPAVMEFPAGTDVWVAGPALPTNRNRTAHNYRTVARLADAAPPARADAALAALSERLAAEFPESNAGRRLQAVPLRDTLVGGVRTTLYVLMGAVVLVLLIASANVANLMFVRGAGRAGEVAVRGALGASRGRIVGQLLIESLLLGAAACGLGWVLAAAGIRGLLRLGVQDGLVPRLDEVVMDWRVLAFGVAVSLAAVIACGLAPALRASRVDVNRVLSRHGRGRVGGRTRGALVVVQIALSCALAVDATLLCRSLLRLGDVSLGFDHAGVLVAYAHAPVREGTSGLDGYLRVGRELEEVTDRLRQLPDVAAAAAVMGLPTGQYGSNGSYAVEGRHVFGGDVRRLPSAGFRLAGPGYFQAMRIPLVRGREFTAADVYEAPFVAIISASLARETFGDEDPIGHRIMCGFDQPDRWMTVVGVVGDVRQASPASSPGPELYMPLRQHPFAANEVQLVVRGRGEPEALAGTVRQVVRSVRPDIAVKFITLDDSIARSTATPRLRAVVIGAFAAVALLLALSGIYAVVTYATAQRTAEFGLRMALGARAADVARLVLTGAGRLAVVGLAAGVLLALATSRVVASMLFEVAPTDVATYAAVIAAAVPLILIAAAIPAWRASRVDPVAAIRGD